MKTAKELERQLEVLREVEKDYPTATIWSARMQIEARIKALAKTVAVLLILTAMAACHTTEFVEVPVVHRDTLRLHTIQHDSINVHDSIFMQVRGDTVTIDRWHTKYIRETVIDTIYQSKTDSVPVPYPVIKEVEKELTWWQQTRMVTGGVAILLLLGSLGFGIIRITKIKWP